MGVVTAPTIETNPNQIQNIDSFQSANLLDSDFSLERIMKGRTNVITDECGKNNPGGFINNEAKEAASDTNINGLSPDRSIGKLQMDSRHAGNFYRTNTGNDAKALKESARRGCGELKWCPRRANEGGIKKKSI